MFGGYIPLVIILILLMLALGGGLAAMPSIAASRIRKNNRISLKPSDIIKNLTDSQYPEVKDNSYLEPYESGEVSKGSFGSYVNIQYYAIILLFVLFDIDMLLLFPWAFNFYHLGFMAFMDTIVFLLMPLFAVYYAFKEGYMRWLR
ncbi:MAG: NADH-quinone oxidoreductase subunit A [Candidatus Thermoplasmatota archaeon]|nr:NADH-quinone oxidoreductase subunit A [Candidatus Thermoplasmatota archaeon]MCL5665226.1 NADH-quinone oxidoreductase subunit A [Candidatus Thermoplasmatota archaeon]